jgi:hypothetical protein
MTDSVGYQGRRLRAAPLAVLGVTALAALVCGATATASGRLGDGPRFGPPLPGLGA